MIVVQFVHARACSAECDWDQVRMTHKNLKLCLGFPPPRSHPAKSLHQNEHGDVITVFHNLLASFLKTLEDQYAPLRAAVAGSPSARASASASLDSSSENLPPAGIKRLQFLVGPDGEQILTCR